MKRNLFDLGGRIALVTGGSRGLGHAIARGLGEAGATLVINGREPAGAEAAAAAFRQEGLNAHAAAFDVADTAAIAPAIQRIEAEIGPIGILVNNAGINRRAPIETYADEDWDAIMRVNLDAVFRVSRAVAAGMIARKSGKIINIASLTSELARMNITPYAASKGAVKMLTKGMATEWAKHNIQVNGIGPGYFLTDLNKPLAADPKFDAWLKARTPAGRWAEPAELAGTAVYLASAAADFVTGQIVYVDGGLLATM